LAEVAALQARAATNQNQSLNKGELRAIFATISDGNSRVQGILALAIGQAERLAGNLKEAADFFSLAANLAHKRGDRLQAVYTTGFLADLQETQGLLRQAALSYQESLKMATTADGKLFTTAATACIGLGRVYYEWNDLENARQYLQQALNLGRHSGIEAAELYAAMPLALVLEGQGSRKEADALLHRAAEIAQKWHSPQIINRVSAVKAHLGLIRGLWQEAAYWPQSNSMTIHDDITASSLAEYCTLARLLIAQTRLDEALLLLDRLRPLAQHASLLRAVIEILGMRALAWQARKNSSEAIAAIEQALSAGEPDGFCRVFLDMGQPMAGLLRQARRQGLFLDYVDKLLAAFQVVESKQPEGELLPEPLSERELEVLQLIRVGATNQEIAGQLFIAVTTVKKHVGNILVKLDAANRVEAIARARDLGILS
jgi:LuxR family maltose regulon positive regulatory protein